MTREGPKDANDGDLDQEVILADEATQVRLGIDASRSLRRLYRLTAGFALVGVSWETTTAGWGSGLGFLLGSLGSFGNLWLFNWLSRAIAPSERPHKPWTASLFIGRYAGLWLIGYATVKALNVSPLPVLLGLLASTAAVLVSAIIDAVGSWNAHKL